MTADLSTKEGRQAAVEASVEAANGVVDAVICCAGLSNPIALTAAVNYFFYSSSNRAISRWVRREAITEDWAGAGIPLNAVAPGIVLTPMTAGLLATPESTKMVDSVVPMPLNYHQSPESIANLLIWLTSEENTHCCGQTVYCDGGSDAVLRGDDVWTFADETVAAALAAAYSKLNNQW